MVKDGIAFVQCGEYVQHRVVSQYRLYGDAVGGCFVVPTAEFGYEALGCVCIFVEVEA